MESAALQDPEHKLERQEKTFLDKFQVSLPTGPYLLLISWDHSSYSRPPGVTVRGAPTWMTMVLRYPGGSAARPREGRGREGWSREP